MTQRTLRTLACLVTVAMPLTGCQRSLPPVTEVEGTVLLDGQPLPHALVQFVPDLQYFGAESNSVGLTDEQGRFQLTCNYNSLPGAVVGKHSVLVQEGPAPADLRGESESSQEGRAVFRARLKNRPIPEKYKILGQSPLVIEVKLGEKNYDLVLSRRS